KGDEVIGRDRRRAAHYRERQIRGVARLEGAAVVFDRRTPKPDLEERPANPAKLAPKAHARSRAVPSSRQGSVSLKKTSTTPAPAPGAPAIVVRTTCGAPPHAVSWLTS